MPAPAYSFFRSLTLPSAAVTEQLARALEPNLGAGDVLLLKGPIGAGKTHFARTLIQARLARFDAVEDVPSPTFTLVQTYIAGTLEIWHADLFRLSGPDDAVELGLLDAFDTALCLVEWPERLGDSAPSDALCLEFAERPGHEGRVVTLCSAAPWENRIDKALGSFAVSHA